MNNKLTDKQVRETIDALSSVPTSKVNGVSFGDIAAALHDLQERRKADSNNHPAHGPLSNYRLHRISDILSKAAAQSDGGNIGYAMSDAVKAIDELLEVRKAEPVAFINGAWTLVYYRPPKEAGLKIGDKLYTAAPAPVVPLTDEQIDDVLDSRGNILYVIADKRERLRMFAREILRAAMLNGGK